MWGWSKNLCCFIGSGYSFDKGSGTYKEQDWRSGDKEAWGKWLQMDFFAVVCENIGITCEWSPRRPYHRGGHKHAGGQMICPMDIS